MVDRDPWNKSPTLGHKQHGTYSGWLTSRDGGGSVVVVLLEVEDVVVVAGEFCACSYRGSLLGQTALTLGCKYE